MVGGTHRCCVHWRRALLCAASMQAIILLRKYRDNTWALAHVLEVLTPYRGSNRPLHALTLAGHSSSDHYLEVMKMVAHVTCNK